MSCIGKLTPCFDVIPDRPGHLNDPEKLKASWRYVLAQNFAAPKEVSNLWGVKRKQGLDRYPPRKRLAKENGMSDKLSTIPSHLKRKVATRARRGFGPDNRMEYDMAKVCAYLVRAKAFYRLLLPMALGESLPRPLTQFDHHEMIYLQWLLLRARNDFLSEYCHQVIDADIIPVRKDEIAEWHEIYTNSCSYNHFLLLASPMKTFEQRRQQKFRLARWCHGIPNAPDKYEAFRMLAAFVGGRQLVETCWCPVCEIWEPKTEETLKLTGHQLPVHHCKMGRNETYRRVGTLSLVAKFCERQAEDRYVWPKL